MTKLVQGLTDQEEVIFRSAVRTGVEDALSALGLSLKKSDPVDAYYAKRLPGEPVFVLLARDPEFYGLVMEWSRRREFMCMMDSNPSSGEEQVRSAVRVAREGAAWRSQNLSTEPWRKP